MHGTELEKISLLCAWIKNVYRVQNCSPQKVIHRFFWASNFESSFITKFEYSRTCRDSIISLVYTAGLMRKHSLILMTIEQKKLLTRALEHLPLLLIKRFVWQLTTARTLSALEFHLMVKKLFMSLKFWKKKKYNGRNRTLF